MGAVKAAPNFRSKMEHPLPTGTAVIALYESCKNCGPSVRKHQKVATRITEVEQDGDTILYTLLDGRIVTPDKILEVK